MSDSSPESGSRTSLENYAAVSVEELKSMPNLRMIEVNDQIRELQTIIRDKLVVLKLYYSPIVVYSSYHRAFGYICSGIHQEATLSSTQIVW